MSGAGAAPRGRLERLCDAASLGPARLGVGIFAVLYGPYVGMELVLGRSLGGPRGADFAGMAGITALLCLLLAYVLAARVALAREAARNFERAMADADLDAGARARLRARLASPPARLLWPCVAFGVAISLAVPLLEVYDEPWHPYDPRLWLPETAWHRVLAPLIGWGVGRVLALALSVSGVFDTLGARLRLRGPLDREPLAPFARQGLAHVVVLVGFVAIFALFLVDVERYGIVVLAVGGLTAGAAGAALLGPMRGIHRRLREAKRAELQRVDRALCSEPGALRGSPIASRAASLGLADLLAWRAAVEAAREWPFDTSTVVRFGLYLLIPLGSWSGGALVERLIDALLE